MFAAYLPACLPAYLPACLCDQPEEAPIVSGIRYMKPEQAAAAGTT
jgi:hypothetical protein